MLLKKTSTSLMSTKLIVFRALFAREILRVDSPVSKMIYVPQVRLPRLPWRKCRDIFVGQDMTRHNKKKATERPLPYCVLSASFLRSTRGLQPWYCQFYSGVSLLEKGQRLLDLFSITTQGAFNGVLLWSETSSKTNLLSVFLFHWTLIKREFMHPCVDEKHCYYLSY